MKKYDFIIIGSGISCLYFLKKVKEANLNLKISIIEKKKFDG
jgi:L-2-hydroxyglutarate oxidase LhgO